MSKRNDPRRDLCANIYDDDGINPRLERKDQASRNTSHKDRQLCKQVGTPINAALQGKAASAILRDLMVIDVEPAPDASRLRVVVDGPALQRVGIAAALDELRTARGFLRLAVGEAISRKRVPELVFAIAAEQEGQDDT